MATKSFKTFEFEKLRIISCFSIFLVAIFLEVAIGQCTNGFYTNPDSSAVYSCSLCEGSCRTCTDSTSCTSCEETMYLNSTTSLCQVWEYDQYYDATTLQCRSCQNSCNLNCMYRSTWYSCSSGMLNVILIMFFNKV